MCRKAEELSLGQIIALQMAARHVHHIVFRSRGGSNHATNGVGLCVPHHLHGIHAGYLEVTGEGGVRLHWKLGTGEAVPLEEWVTLGDDDVRRADTDARPGDAGDARRGDQAPRADQVRRTPGGGLDGAGFVGEGDAYGAQFLADSDACGVDFVAEGRACRCYPGRRRARPTRNPSASSAAAAPATAA
jgi:hypothetical protein